MAQLDPSNPFQAWKLSEQEILQGSIFSNLQKQCLQNERAKLAAERINLKFDPANPQEFIQQDAELQGKIGLLGYLIDLSDSAEKLVNPTNQSLVINDGNPV
mgnify:CR=1 FL=1